MKTVKRFPLYEKKFFPVKIERELIRLSNQVRDLQLARQNYLSGFMSSLDVPDDARFELDLEINPPTYRLINPEETSGEELDSPSNEE